MAGMQPSDVFELTWVADPRISPDGSRVAFVVMAIDRDANGYTGNIWIAPTGAPGAPVRFTTGAKLDSQPRWSPDGSSLAFVSNRAGEVAQLFVMPVAGGEARRLTDLPESVTDPAWSPDARYLAFCSRARDPAYEEEDDRRRAPRRITRLRSMLDDVGWLAGRRRHVYVVAADGSQPPRQITSGDFDDGEPTWSPNGARIAFCAARHDDWDVDTASDVYAVDAAGGEPDRLTGTDGSCSAASWSPDGGSIAYHYIPGRWDEPRNPQIAVVDVASGATRVLTESLDRPCTPYPPVREPIWDGDDILFVVEDRGNNVPYRVAATGAGKPRPVLDANVWVAGVDAREGIVATVRSAPTGLPELYVGDRRVTEIGEPFTRARDLVEPQRFVATSPDGAEVDAWFVPPAGVEPGRRYPVLLSIHGGPFTQYGNRFFDEIQVYAGAGYAVVYSNPRGSSGYGETWGRAIRGPVADGPGMASVDYDDLMAVLDEALERFDVCDPQRLGVLGGSYGGFMTSWIVARTDRFAAACSERAVNNWLSFYGSSDEGPFFRGYIGAFPFEAPEAYLQLSPAMRATEITTPLLIVHSEDDLRCDVEQAQQLFTTLRLLRRDVEFVRFPKESHELSRSGSPVHRVMRFDVILEWFDRYLKRPASRPVGEG